MTVSGRRLPFAGIAIAIDRVTDTKGRSRPEAAIQASCCERRIWDRKADIAYEEIIVRRSIWLDGPLSQARADIWSGISERLRLAKRRHSGTPLPV